MTDVVIMGAGPAGLTLGCYLAQAGVDCLVLERTNHPRPHVGESLMPSTLRVIRDIGFHGLVEAAGFPHSGGVVYHPQVGFDTTLAYRDFPQDGIDQPYTYHVDRARFDMLLLKHAETQGCRVIQGAGVDEVLFDEDGRARGVTITLGGQTVEIDARVVVDAGGRSTRLGRQLDLREDHPLFDQFALHAWCIDVDRGRRKTADYTHVYFLPDVRGWAWLATIDQDITSVGLVASRAAYQDSGLDIDDFFEASLAGNRKLARATHRARRINDLKGEVNYSYRLTQVCGDGWMAIGDAARFIDPIFSSGVSVAMHSARSASECIIAGLRAGDVSKERFAPYQDQLFTETAIWDDFIRMFYRLLPAFTHLLESKDHRLAMVQMIQGEVGPHSDDALLQEMRALVRETEEADAHPWRSQLLDLPS